MSVLRFTAFDQIGQLIGARLTDGFFPRWYFFLDGCIHRISSRVSNTSRNLLLLYGIDQLLDGLLDKVEVLHFHGFVFFHSGFDGEKSCLIQLLRFENHFDPLFLLFFEICHDCLVINQVLFILREILGTYVFDLFQLFVVSLINVVIIVVHIFSGRLNELFQLINLIFLTRCDVISQVVDFRPESDPGVIMLLSVLVSIIRLGLLQVVDSQCIVIFKFGQIVLSYLLVLQDF